MDVTAAHTVEFFIPPDYIGKIMGPKGSTIAAIRAQFHVAITIRHSGSSGLTIEGARQDVERCQDHLCTLLRGLLPSYLTLPPSAWQPPEQPKKQTPFVPLPLPKRTLCVPPSAAAPPDSWGSSATTTTEDFSLKEIEDMTQPLPPSTVESVHRLIAALATPPPPPPLATDPRVLPEIKSLLNGFESWNSLNASITSCE